MPRNNHVNRAAAERRAVEVLPIVREMRTAGATLREIAEALDARGIRAPNGGTWQVSSVHALLQRRDPEAARHPRGTSIVHVGNTGN